MHHLLACIIGQRLESVRMIRIDPLNRDPCRKLVRIIGYSKLLMGLGLANRLSMTVHIGGARINVDFPTCLLVNRATLCSRPGLALRDPCFCTCPTEKGGCTCTRRALGSSRDTLILLLQMGYPIRLGRRLVIQICASLNR